MGTTRALRVRGVSAGSPGVRGGPLMRACRRGCPDPVVPCWAAGIWLRRSRCGPQGVCRVWDGRRLIGNAMRESRGNGHREMPPLISEHDPDSLRRPRRAANDIVGPWSGLHAPSSAPARPQRDAIRPPNAATYWPGTERRRRGLACLTFWMHPLASYRRHTHEPSGQTVPRILRSPPRWTGTAPVGRFVEGVAVEPRHRGPCTPSGDGPATGAPADRCSSLPRRIRRRPDVGVGVVLVPLERPGLA